MSKQTTSWQDSLKNFLESNPELPEGQDPEVHSDTPESASIQRLDIIYERKGRAGKPVTIISGFDASYPDNIIEALASELKRTLGCGGSCRGGEILLQGDRRENIRRILTEKGHKVRII